VTSGRSAAYSHASLERELDARPAAADPQPATTPGRFSVEPELIDCDALVDTRRVHTIAAAPAAVESSNDIRRIAS
jgi:hypothetical protein